MSASTAKQDGEAARKAGQQDIVETPPLVFLTNKWIQELTQRIRSRPIPWEGYHRADLLSAEELKMIKSVDAILVGQNRAKLDPLFEQQGQEYVSLYLRLLSKLSRTDTLQQILVLIDDMLTDHDDRLALFLALDGQEQQDGIGFPWKPFVKLLDVPDDFVQTKSAHFLTLMLVYSASSSSKRPGPPPVVLPRLLSFLSSLLRGATSTAKGSTSAAASQQQSQQTQSSSSSSSSAAVAAAANRAPSTAGSSASSRRASPDYAEGNGPEIALVLLESLLRTQSYRELVWDAEVAKMGTAARGDTEGGSDNDKEDDALQQADVDRGLFSELAHILRLSTLPSSASSNFTSSLNSPAGSGSATPSRQTASSGASTLVAGILGNGNGNGNGSAARAGTQLVYQAVLCFWLLSFNRDIAADVNVKLGLVPLLADVARNAVKEKVTRVTVATLRNLLAKAPDANASAMLGSKCLPLAENLLTRKWSDEEIEDDLAFIKDDLAHRLQGMTTYDEYLSELTSGQLTFESPVHELDDFWKANAPKLVDDDARVLKQLVAILSDSDDPTTLAVACSDLGKFVHFFEQGKKRVGDLGAKNRCMQLMSHPDPNVKFYALHTVGKLVSASWR
ncbi:ARM repeat-containing protein [Testicularia cyperi]|uniref:ARM repeat-containing protein n=1 Tax=Testicularia cyperi TaxID=1882483 RepID=A0A317XPL3_9BASI|nr:ARM repeat-containing protein [Testicularia cyperi]